MRLILPWSVFLMTDQSDHRRQGCHLLWTSMLFYWLISLKRVIRYNVDVQGIWTILRADWQGFYLKRDLVSKQKIPENFVRDERTEQRCQHWAVDSEPSQTVFVISPSTLRPPQLCWCWQPWPFKCNKTPPPRGYWRQSESSTPVNRQLVIQIFPIQFQLRHQLNGHAVGQSLDKVSPLIQKPI